MHAWFVINGLKHAKTPARPFKSIISLCYSYPNNQSLIDLKGIGDIELTNHLLAMVFLAVSNALKESRLSISGLFEHQIKRLTSHINNLAVLLRNSNHPKHPTQPWCYKQTWPDVASVLFCSWGKLNWEYSPQCHNVRVSPWECCECVLQGMLAYFGICSPFCLYTVRHRHAHTCARMTGVKHNWTSTVSVDTHGKFHM